MLLCRPVLADTTETTWTGSGTNWSTGAGNWAGGTAPSSTVSAVFNTTTGYTNQPTLTTASTSQGIWDNGATGGVTTTIGGTFGLTVTGNATLNSIANAGILLDGSGNNNLTISSAVTGVTLTNSTGFYVNNGGTLTVAAPIALGGNTLTLGSTLTSGSGSILISGSVGGTGGVTMNDAAGTSSATLSGIGAYTGATAVNGGTLTLSGTLNGTSGITINGATANFNETSTGVYAGTKAFTLTTGTATLGGVNTYTGATSVNGGLLVISGNNLGHGAVTTGTAILQLQNANAISHSALTLNTSGTLQLRNDTNTTFGTNGVTINGNSTINVDRLTGAGAAGTTLGLGGITSYNGIYTLTLTNADGYNVALGAMLDNNAAGATLTNNMTSGTATISSVTTTNGNIGMIFNGSGVTIVGALVQGANAGAFTQSGPGTLVLNGASGASNISGATETLSNGTLNANTAGLNGGGTLIWSGGLLQAGSGGLITAKTVTLTNSGTFDSNGYNSTLSGIISSTGTLVKIGNGSLTLSAANTFSGGVSLNTGTLAVGNAAALGTGTFTIASNGVSLDASSAVTLTAPAQNWNGDFTFVGSNALNTGTAAIVLGAGRTVTVNASTLTIGGTISGAYGLTKAGAGTLSLTGTNVFTGGVTLNAGTLSLGSAGALGSGTLTINGGALDASVATVLNGSNSQNWNGNFAYVGTSTLNTGTARVTLGGTTAVTVNASTLTVGGVITDSGSAYGLTKLGAGTLALSGSAKTYTGATTVNQGVLALNFNTAGTTTINIISGSSQLTLGGGTLSITGSTGLATSQTFNGMTVNPGLDTITVATGTDTLALGAITRNTGGALYFTNMPAASGTIATTSSGNDASGILGPWATGGATQATYNYVTVNSGMILGYSGQTTATANLANVTNTGTNFNFSGNQTLGGSSSANTLRNTGAATTIALAGNNLTVNGLMNAGTGLVTVSGSGNLMSGTYQELAITSFGQNVTISSTIADSLSGTSALSWTPIGTGTLTLSNTGNTYTGNTYLNGGVTNIAADASLGVAPGSLVANQLTLSNNATLQLAGSFNLASNRGITINAGGGTIDTQTFTGTYGGIIAGSGGLTKVGAGTLALSGSNTYGGVTTLSSGTLTGGNLQAFGANTGTAALTLAASTTLNLLNDNSGTFSPNAGTGYNATINGNATINVDHAANNTGNTLALGNVAITGAYTLTLTNGDSYNLALGAVTIAAATSFTNNMTSGTATLGSLVNTAAITATFNGTSPSAVTSVGSITQNTGVLAITQSGSGTLLLTGYNTYTGATTVSSGTLSLTGTLAGATAITLGANTTLAESATGNIYGTGASLVVNAGATATLNGTNNYAGATTLSGGLITINGALMGGSAITVSSGTLTEASNASISGVIGSLVVNGGTVTLSGSNTFGSYAPTPVKITAGTVTLNGYLWGGINNTTTFTVTGGAFSEGSNGSINGGQNLSISNISSTLSGSNTYFGATTVSSGTVTLSGSNGSLVNTTGETITNGKLVLDNTGAGNNNSSRVPTAVPVTLSNASLVYLGSDQAATNSSQLVGTGTLGASALGAYNTITSSFGGTNAATLTFASLTRTVGTGGIALVNGTNLGANTIAGGSVGQVLVTAAPTLVGTTASGTFGINAGTLNTQIVPFLLGESGTASGAKGTATGVADTFLTYNATTGLRPLNPTDEFKNNAIVATDNTYITANTVSSASGTTAINSLVINGGNLVINDSTTLADSSGALLFVTGNTIAPSASTGALQLGGATTEGIISVDAGVTGNISAALAGSGTISAYGPGNMVFSGNSGTGAFTVLEVNDNLTVSGSNRYTGTIDINTDGTLIVANNNAFGNATLTLAGGTFKADNQARTVGATLVGGSGFIGGNNNLTFTGASNGIAATFNANSSALFSFANAATTTISGTFALDNAGAGNFYSNNGEGLVIGSGVNVVITGPITDNLSGINASGATQGSQMTYSFHGTGGNITINGDNSYGNLVSSGPVTNNYGYNTLTLGGPGGSGAVITPLGLTTINSNTAGFYLQALNNGQILPNNITFGNSINNLGSTAIGFTGTNSMTLSGSITMGSAQLILPNISSATLTFSGTTAEGGTTFEIIGSGNNTFASTSAITGTTGGFTSVSSGTLTMSGTIGVTGAENLNGGTVILDYSGSSANGGAGSRLTNGGTFTLGGVNLQLSGGSFTQTVASGTTALGSGQSRITQTNSGSSVLASGTIVRSAGGTIDFGSGAATTTTALTSGILGGYATVSGSDWATVASGTVVALAGGSYAPFVSSAGVSTSNYALTDGTSMTASGTFNSLKILTTQANQSLSIGSANTFTLASGGLLFTGTNNYAINAGTLKSGTVTDLIIQQYGSGTLTISSTIANGTGTLTKAGSGSLVLTGSNTYTGTTYINGGTVSIGADVNLGSTATPGALNFNGGTLETTAGFTSARAVTLSANGGTFQVDSGTLSLTGTISGQTFSSLTKTGAGTLFLSGNNTYSGPTTISNGILQVGSLTALGPSSAGATYSRTYSPVNVSGGTLDINGFSIVVGNVTLAGGSIVDSSGTATLGAYSYTLQSGSVSAALGDMISNTASTTNIDNSIDLYKTTSGTVVLTGSNTFTGFTSIGAGTLQIGNGGASGQLGGGSVTDNAALLVNLSSTYALNNSITGSGTFIQAGTGTTLLTGGNTYTGPTNILNGVLSISTVGTGTANGQSLGSGNTVNLGVSGTSSGILRYTGVSGTLDKNIFALGNGGDTISNTGGGLLTLSGTLTKANTVLTLSGGAFNVTGQITGGSNSTFNSDFDVNNATVTLSATNNNYVGPTYLYNGGTLLNGVTNALPAGTVLTTGSSTDAVVTNTYNLNGFSQSIAALNSVSSGSNVNIVTTSGTTGTSTLTLSGVESGTNGGSTVANGSFGGSISDSGSGATISLVVSGGTQTLSGSNTYSGATSVTSGTLILTGALGNTAVTVGNATTASLTPTLTGGVTSGGTITPAGATFGYYAPGLSAGYIAGGVTLSGSGAGVSAGILTAGSVGSASGTVGTLTIGSVTLNAGSVANYVFNASSGMNSMIDVTGVLTLNGGGINLYTASGGTSGTFTTSGTYDLFQYGSLASGTGAVNNLSVLNAASGESYAFGTASLGGTNYVTLTIGLAVNPTTYTLAATSGTGRIMLNGTTSLVSTITNTGTGIADTLDFTNLNVSTTGSTSGGNLPLASGGPLANNNAGVASGTTIFTGNATGVYTITPTVGTATNATLSGSAIASGTTTASVTVVQNRVITSSTADLGNVLVSATTAAVTANLTSTGDYNHNTTVTILSGTSTSGGVSAVSGSSQTFDGTNTTGSVSLTGNFATSGTKTGSVSLAVSGEGLAGESDSGTAAYKANVFQGVSTGDLITGGTVSGGGTTIDLTLGIGASTDGGQRAAVTVTGFASSDPNLVVTPTGNSTGVATGSSTTPVVVGTVSAVSSSLNGSYTYTATETGTTAYTDSTLAAQGTPGTATWTGITVTVSGHTSSGAFQVLSSVIQSGGSLDGLGATSAVPGGYATTATLVGGTVGSQSTVSMSYSPNGTLHPPSAYAVSDVLSLTISGTGAQASGPDGSNLTDVFVLQMTYGTQAVGTKYIGWWDPALGLWVNAIAGNSNSNLLADYLGTNELDESYADYVAANPTLTLEEQLGAFGYDSTTNSAWAVLDHNSDFVVIPEPATWGMILSGFGMLIGIQRLRKRRSGS